MMVNAQQWLSDFDLTCPAIMLTELQLDSRLLDAHSAFVAIPGHQVDGREFIPQAVSLGVPLVLTHTDSAAEHGRQDWREHSLVLSFYQLSHHVSALAAAFFVQPAKAMQIVAVTGTNGKTTTAQLVAQLAQLLNTTAGTIGTNGAGLINKLSATTNTTPDPISVQRMLAEMRQQGAQLVSLEASSHALVQGRIQALKTDVAVFTNLSRDHLDYHQTMQAYGRAKRLLLKQPELQYAVLNAQDEQTDLWLEVRPASVKPVLVASGPIGYGDKLYCYASNIDYHPHGSRIDINSSWGDGQIISPLIGHFNVFNLLAAVSSLLCLGYALNSVIQACEQLHAAAGRMELFTLPNGPALIVDYAHTPDALEQALIAMRRHCRGQLWCLFGCGGDRDQGKRPLMGEVAERLADRVMLTNDNTRGEDAQAIIQQIKQGCQHPADVLVECDRPGAIQQLIQMAQPGDMILLAGKGHEDYQILGTQRVAYNERAFVASLVEEAVA